MRMASFLAGVIAASCAFAQNTIPEPITTIAFGSCLRETRPVPILDTVNAIRPDVFVFLGDNIYGDSQDMNVLRGKYEVLGAIESFKTLRRQSRVLATWDDHDYGRNDAGREYPKKADSQRVFLDFWGDAPDSPRRSREGVYDSYTFGPEGRRVQIIVLDTRFFRDALERDPAEERVRYRPTADTSKTVLGEAQWIWLGDQLSQPAEVRIIASSIQLLSSEHKFEKWNNFPHERGRLLDALAASSGEAFVLSGDRHFGEIATLKVNNKTIYEITSSSLTHSSWRNREEPNACRVPGSFLGDNNFGLIEIEWGDRPVVRASLIDQTGERRSSIETPN